MRSAEEKVLHCFLLTAASMSQQVKTTQNVETTPVFSIIGLPLYIVHSYLLCFCPCLYLGRTDLGYQTQMPTMVLMVGKRAS